MNRPKVSIGLAVYNGEKYLEFAVRSLLAQTYSDFELILSDNASTDRTEAICRDFAASDARIRYHRSDRNIGANPNFNRVRQLSTGEYFKWAAYDDVCRPQYLEKCVAALDADPSIILAHSKTAIINDEGFLIDTSPEGLSANQIEPNEIDDPPRDFLSPKPARRFSEILLYSKWCFEIFGLIRSSALTDPNPMSDYYGTDKVFMAMLALKGPFYEVDEPLFLRRHHEEQSSYRSSEVLAEWAGASESGRFGAQGRCLKGYIQVVNEAHLTPGQRMACYAVIARYLLQLRKWPAILGVARQHKVHLASTGHLPAEEAIWNKPHSDAATLAVKNLPS